MKIVIDDKIPFIRGVLEPFADVLYLPGSRITPADVHDADALIVRTRTTCNSALLANSAVKVVATATIGFDHINTAELDALGIRWFNAPGCNAASVKNYIASALANLPLDLENKTLGIIGVGNVGKLVADVGRAFNMRVLLNDPPRADKEGKAAFTDLPELLQLSDVVTTHVPLETGGAYPTLNMADEKFFSAMKDGAYFFNSCRGEIIVPSALKSALRNGKPAGALLDVWPAEPNLDPELVKLVKFGTPHIAGYSKDGKANGTAMAVQVIAEFFGIDALRHWRPDTLPPPVYPVEITLPPNLSRRQQLNAAILHAYDIMNDVKQLYADVQNFEQHRGSYWNRREFHAFTVTGASPETEPALRLLGFNVK